MKKRILAVLLTMVFCTALMAGCGKDVKETTKETTASTQASQQSEPTQASSKESQEDAKNEDFDTSTDITVISREDGSGTRGAFIELFGIEEKNESGEKVDNTTDTASVTNNTSVMMTTVAGNEYAIGYISLGSMNETVKPLKIDGVEASVANIENDTYKIARPFNIVTKEGLSEVAQDFMDFILSAEGQKVIEDSGYIPVSDAAAYAGSKPEGKVVVAGSSSVSPVMEKLKEAYLEVNTGAEIEIQTSDSTTGVTSTIEGICDIGMASRELKDSETAEGVTGTKIAMDGIAVIVNLNNPLNELTSEQVKSIYVGDVLTWDDATK